MPAKKLTREEFVAVWTQAVSLEEAAVALGVKVRSVTRRANRMRAAGTPLKTLTDQKFNRHACPREVRPLTDDERAFMAFHYDFAQRVAYKTCRSMDLPPQWATDMVEDAATEALLLIARRSTEPGFVPETTKGLVVTAVRRQVWQMRKKFFGPVRAGGDIVKAASGRSPTPMQTAIDCEDGVRVAGENEVAGRLIGSMPDTSRRKESSARREYLSLRTKASELGLSTAGTSDELRERLAAYYRTKLAPADFVEYEQPAVEISPPDEQVEQESTAAPVVPESIRQRLAPTPPAKSRRQRAAERFVVAWQTSGCAQEAARRLGRSVPSAAAYARRLRSLGVENLKELPTSPGPLVRAVRALVPSLN